MPPHKKPANFADTLAELESLADNLESNDTSLEQSLGDFEKGIQLIRQAQQSLQEAEQKVQMLLEKDGDPVETPLTDSEDKGESIQ